MQFSTDKKFEVFGQFAIAHSRRWGGRPVSWGLDRDELAVGVGFWPGHGYVWSNNKRA